MATRGLTITAVQVSGSNVLISFTARAGVSYRVEYANSLPASAWLTLADSIPGNGGVVQVVDAGSAGKVARFYRIRQLP
jgi:hypothetical protein